MLKLLINFFLICILLNTTVVSQIQKKLFIARRVENPPTIDGYINDKAWISSEKISNFIQYEPYNGNTPSEKTEVMLVYDDKAIYIAAIMHDTKPMLIPSELGKRDDYDLLNSDQFVIDINPFNDGVNSFMFAVSSSGIQSDIKRNEDDLDKNWDAVWKSKARLTDNGWVVELKIPHSAIRFSKKIFQVWGLNFYRLIKRKEEFISWNFVNKDFSGFANQMGQLIDIKHINPPVRLSLSPYVSAYMENKSSNNIWKKTIKGGIDLKYGINQSFTLDMILIPDFKQVESDEQLLNLSPFEVKYDDKRAFFTESTELFNKANIFYSKRIGSKPVNYKGAKSGLNTNEIIDENPVETGLINATKLSGRTVNGLGIGFFNAITRNTNAIIVDTISKTKREYTTQALSNYNIIVFDKQLENNSHLSFINTNVSRFNSNYTANVTATDFKFFNQENNYSLSGNGAVSYMHNTGNDDIGFSTSINIDKISGKFQFRFSNKIISDKYEPNDIGYLKHNNEINEKITFIYNINKPFWRILRWQNSLYFKYATLYKPIKFFNFKIQYNTNITFKNHFSYEFYLSSKPLGYNDFYEARKDGQVYKIPKVFYWGAYLKTDNRKKLYLVLNYKNWKINKTNEKRDRYSIISYFRISGSFVFSHELLYEIRQNELAYADTENDLIIFGKRDVNTISNTFNSTYIFNNKSSLDFKIRHYWSSVKYNNYYLLDENGDLNSQNFYNNNNDINYNVFNIDLIYRWQFLPGSELLLVWKNAIYDDSDIIVTDYFDNLSNTYDATKVNLISIKILYYIDYQNFKRKKTAFFINQ